ncbi:MAG TPA: RHS repeat domain-containing protein, partial [Bryobacteraceae bacterium]|nr:RHS repeat domain-containing protein [Bryobacteraceae bacterium]
MLTLPTGGRYEYDYTTYVNSQGSPAAYEIQRRLLQKRIFLSSTTTLADQVINYSPGSITYSDGSHEIHYGTVLDSPLLDGTLYMGWMNGKETGVDYYDSAANGGGLLKSTRSTYQQRDCSTETTCWFGDPQALSSPAHDPQLASETVTIGSEVSQNRYVAYDIYNNVKEVDEYGFGTGAAASFPSRKTFTNFQYYTGSPYILNMVTSRQVTDGSGNLAAQTTYAYDESAYPLTGYGAVASHDSNYSASNTLRGNATTVTSVLNDPVNGVSNAQLASHYYYDIAGNIVASVDPRGVRHDYAYNDSLSTYALPTSVKSYTGVLGTGATLSASITYDYNIGKPTSTTDVNGNITTYGYNDLLDRLKTIIHPDGGTVTFNYNDAPGSLSTGIVIDQKLAGDGNLKSYVFYDGLGRESETSRQAGSQNIMTCKTYDVRSRLLSVSNPAYSSAVFGFPDTGICGSNATTFTYDGLSRQITATLPDGSMTQHKYRADSATHTNQTLEIEPGAAGQQPNRLQSADAAGRLVAIDENVTSWQGGTYGIPGQLTYHTGYFYDPLDDLTGVNQSGQSRTFTYDSLKRLVQTFNPESGTIRYSYDTSGNLSTRSDGRSVQLTFSAYDGLNRVTGKSYNDGATPAVTYSYGDTLSGCNLKGRLTGVTAASAPSRIYNYTCYNWAGRPLTVSQNTNSVPYPMSYSYDLAGELTSFTFPSNRQQSITYDTGGRPSGVSGLFGGFSTTYASSFAYFPNGSTDNLQLGPNFLRQQYCQNNRLQTTGVRLGPAGAGTTGNCANGGDLLNLGIGYPSAG